MNQHLFVVSVLTVGLSGLNGCSEKTAVVETRESKVTKTGPKTVTFDPQALQRLGVKVDSAGSSAHAYDFDVSGTLEYAHDKYAEVGSIADGRVMAIRVHEGDLVKKNQVLATVMIPAIAGAQAEYVASAAAAKNAKVNEEREATLLTKDLTTAREAEVAKSEAVRTQADLSAAEAKLQALSVGKPASGASIAGAGTFQLVAPIDGIVVRRSVVLGRFLQAKETAFVVADPVDLRAAIHVYESDLPYFRIGAAAEITVDAVPGKTFHGTVSLIEADVDRKSRSVRALINVPNPDRALRPGEFMRAAVKLPENARPGVLFVPGAAVQPLGEEDVVFIEREPGNFEVRRVVVARRTAQVAEISEGLSRGERIAVEGAFILRGEVSKQ